MKTIRLLGAAIMLGLGAVGCSTTTHAPTSAGLTVVLTPATPLSAATAAQTIDVLQARLHQLGASYQIEQIGGSLRLNVSLEGASAQTLMSVASLGELLFRPVLCTTGNGADATLTVFPPYAGPSDPAAAAVAPAGDDCPLVDTGGAGSVPTTNPAADDPAATVLLASADTSGTAADPSAARFLLGPAQLTGKILSMAVAQPPDAYSSVWYVQVNFTRSGSSAFNAFASANYRQFVAIDFDGVVESTPQIQTTTFNGSAFIDGSTFNEAQAKNLALILQFGALPVRLSAGAVDSYRVVAGSNLGAFRAGAQGSEVDVPATDVRADPSTLAGALARAHVEDFQVARAGRTVIVTVLGPKATPGALLTTLGLSRARDQAVATGVVVAASRG